MKEHGLLASRHRLGPAFYCQRPEGLQILLEKQLVRLLLESRKDRVRIDGETRIGLVDWLVDVFLRQGMIRVRSGRWRHYLLHWQWGWSSLCELVIVVHSWKRAAALPGEQ